MGRVLDPLLCVFLAGIQSVGIGRACVCVCVCVCEREKERERVLACLCVCGIQRRLVYRIGPLDCVSGPRP